MAKLRITQRKSAIGSSPSQKGTIRALGLRRIGHSKIHDDSPAIRGMVAAVQHLVDVQPAEEKT